MTLMTIPLLPQNRIASLRHQQQSGQTLDQGTECPCPHVPMPHARIPHTPCPMCPCAHAPCAHGVWHHNQHDKRGTNATEHMVGQALSTYAIWSRGPSPM